MSKRKVMGMILNLVRGLPGSGKSTFAKSLGCAHFEADMFHIRNGAYRWHPDNVSDSHLWCQESAIGALRFMDVVVSNTFSQLWEMEPYLNAASDVRVFKCVGSWDNVHGVPSSAVKRMRDRWEGFAGEVLVND